MYHFDRRKKWNQKPCMKTKKVIDRGKRSKTLSEVKSVENINKYPQSFLEDFPSHKLRDHTYD